MVNELREKFNGEFEEEKYQNLINDLWRYNGGKPDFRVCESPFFLSDDFAAELTNACQTIIGELDKKELKSASSKGLPDVYEVYGQDERPVFLQLDFAVTKNSDGKFIPQLIELQGFPSLYAFQAEISQKVKERFNLDENLSSFFSGLNYESYTRLFRKTLLGNSDPENVILLEIEPTQQKTFVDFYYTEKLTGIKPVCITDVVQRGDRLFYNSQGKEIPIERIYNRVIFDELERKDIEHGINLKEPLDVTWVGHPNWFFLISKYSLPLLKNKYVPECYYLNEVNTKELNLAEFVLKPLFSFAGAGVEIDLTPEILSKISDRENYILQKKVEYEPVLKTPDGFSKVEIRMMFLWNEKPLLVNNLVRTTKGKMVGVDYNKDKTWIGSNIAFHSGKF
ncbi:MAG: hypothetical protein GXO87_08435 [Chlorobi bacterium]|nr:hypothetical protein [Chlorobiota bacterium]